ncbi:PAS domain-containing hybrid sensor histidine kinase/response regulator [Snuella sedimenti]|uniref:histidine kinase n=1 Tax=Snuella sedimenti TaxID=2798802 RepID=A0A8J7IGL5_9FLAO|nr:ATP-binding protein [Snuella sedimenti]MBJ6369317.1 response regulator [Snuella sedimenti]
MLNNNLHRLLKRQLEKSGLDVEGQPGFADFLNMVDQAYKGFDKDVSHIENILEKSSKELFVANQKLKYERDFTKTKLQNIVDNLGGVIFETNLEGNFTFLNNAWTKYSGFPLEDSIGKSFKDFLKEENIEGNKKFDEIFYSGKEKVKFIFKNKYNNKVSWFEVKAKLIYNANGYPTGFIGTIIDVTNLKETEIELHKASKSKDTFLSTMSHEIRTPLNAVTGLTNILLMEKHLPDQTENLKALKYSGEHLLGLINDLLDFDKIKSGKLKVNEEDFNLDYFLENIESHFKLRADSKGIAFRLQKGDDLPANIIGDRLKLAQIVKNLLSNSLKFTEQGSITLSVKNFGIDKNKVKLQFSVIDTGIGISADKQEAIFESFMQAGSETSVKYGGTGLGLSISKKLLNLQNSDLRVESELGKGATFTFDITYKISNRLNVYEPNMIKIQPTYDALNVNVLVAEDNKMNILILKRFFSNWKVNFKIAENGKELLDIYRETDFDLILMDLQMPLIDGYEATRVIRELPDDNKANIPIIALTAFAQTDIKEKTKHYKMNGFMGKPFNPEKLYLLLKSYSKEAINKKAM